MRSVKKCLRANIWKYEANNLQWNTELLLMYIYIRTIWYTDPLFVVALLFASSKKFHLAQVSYICFFLSSHAFILSPIFFYPFTVYAYIYLSVGKMHSTRYLTMRSCFYYYDNLCSFTDRYICFSLHSHSPDPLAPAKLLLHECHGRAFSDERTRREAWQDQWRERERWRKRGREKRLAGYRREPMSLHLERTAGGTRGRHTRTQYREREEERDGREGSCSPSARLIN